MAFNLYQLLAIVHFLALCGLVVYGCHRLWFLYLWVRLRKKQKHDYSAYRSLDIPYPKVTVQLPIYNERFVAARLLDAVVRLDWPLDRLEIQVLDDSDDETQDLLKDRIAYWQLRKRDIKLITRETRDGFKAGALECGLRRAEGELLAIFDADFIPPRDFLKRTVFKFADPSVGMVQTRWSFVNTDHSWLTQIQAMMLAPHFSIEHRVRSHQGYFFNFNGTAGIWRKEAILSSGGWQSDTVTEDLDLSYRAQLKGWRFNYLEDVAVPSELPSTLGGFRSQQKRWARGSIQTARKILPLVFRSRALPFKVKIEAAFHLLANMGWLFGALVTLTLYPTIVYRVESGLYQYLFLDLLLFCGGCGAIMLYFSWYALFKKQRTRVLWVLLLPAFAIGLAPSLASSVIQGAIRRGGQFERTPKFGIRGKSRLPGIASIYRRTTVAAFGIDALFLLYCLLPIVFVMRKETWAAVPLLLLFPIGFLIVSTKTFDELVRQRAKQ